MYRVIVRYKEFAEQHFTNVVEVINKNKSIVVEFNNGNRMVIPESNVLTYFIAQESQPVPVVEKVEEVEENTNDA